MEDANLAAAERLYDALEADEMDAVLALCSPDVEWVYPGGTTLAYAGRWSGHDGVLRWGDAHDQAEEILDFRVDTGVAGGDLVVVLGYFQGRAKPSGKTWETTFAHALTFQDGLLVRFEALFDTSAAVRAHEG